MLGTGKIRKVKTKKKTRFEGPLVRIYTGNFELEIGSTFRLYFNLPRAIKYFWQRRIRGFDSFELYSLDSTISKFILPRLKAFRKEAMSYPNDFKNIKDWQKAMDKMIGAFEYNMSDWDGDKKMFNQKNRDYKAGMELFAKYYGHLWA